MCFLAFLMIYTTCSTWVSQSKFLDIPTLHSVTLSTLDYVILSTTMGFTWGGWQLKQIIISFSFVVFTFCYFVWNHDTTPLTASCRRRHSGMLLTEQSWVEKYLNFSTWYLQVFFHVLEYIWKHTKVLVLEYNWKILECSSTFSSTFKLFFLNAFCL